MTKVVVLLSDNYTGHYAHYMMLHGTTKFQADTRYAYPESFKIGDLERNIDQDTETVFIIGFPYRQREAAYLTDLRGSLKIYHFASFGDRIIRPNAVSTVSEEDSPLRDLALTVGYLGASTDEQKELLTDISEGINTYHTYTMEEGEKVPMYLKLLSDFYGRNIAAADIAKPTLDDFLASQEAICWQLDTNMNQYIQRKIGEFRLKQATANGKVINIGLVFAEQHPNEVAHALFEKYAAYVPNMVALVGRHTKGSDMFAVRTGVSVNAAQIAKHINDGNGKAQTANVFLTDGPTGLINAVVAQLTEALSSNML